MCLIFTFLLIVQNVGFFILLFYTEDVWASRSQLCHGETPNAASSGLPAGQTTQKASQETQAGTGLSGSGEEVCPQHGLHPLPLSIKNIQP